MPESLIAHQVERLKDDFGLIPVVASEIEFYLHGSCEADLAPLWRKVEQDCVAYGVSLYKIEKETGYGQHEIALAVRRDAMQAADDIAVLKRLLLEVSQHYSVQADFAAKPLTDQPGSGLHFHIHLENAAGRNVFYKDDDRMSDELRFSIGGLLNALAGDISIFAPAPESRRRFTAGSNAPTTVSWGANNRTVAIRLPDSARDAKRIEHRVAGADASPHEVLAAILRGIYDGLTRRLDPGPQIYGDAALPMYNLPRLVN